MADLKIQRTIVALGIAIIAIVIAGVAKGWFGPDKVEITNLPKEKDTLLIKTVDGPKPEPVPGPGEKPTDDKTTTVTTFLPPVDNSDKKTKKEEPRISSNKFVAEWLVVNSTGNQLKEILEEVGTVLEEKGNTVVISNVESISIDELNGKYNKLATVSVKLNFSPDPNTTDARTISTRYSYSIKIYDVNTKKLIASAAAQDAQPGFNKEETLSAIKKRVLSHLKEKL